MTTATQLKPAAVAKALRPHVDTLLMATVVAKMERERVDAIQKRVLSDQNYYGRLRPDNRQVRITDPKVAYLLDDDSASRYYARLNAIHEAEGFEGAKDGNCPACTAEHLQTQAEWALIEAAGEFFPDVTNDKLLCGTKELGGLECRQKYLDLLIGLVVNSPGYRSPLKR